mmetsp:Transcript_48535/g.144967  ORF Transcript_48535/g.144967 Transcript_48535/m.144967 type:complete len:287 (+) Transcript_48535:58-918(+)
MSSPRWPPQPPSAEAAAPVRSRRCSLSFFSFFSFLLLLCSLPGEPASGVGAGGARLPSRSCFCHSSKHSLLGGAGAAAPRICCCHSWKRWRADGGKPARTMCCQAVNCSTLSIRAKPSGCQLATGDASGPLASVSESISPLPLSPPAWASPACMWGRLTRSLRAASTSKARGRSFSFWEAMAMAFDAFVICSTCFLMSSLATSWCASTSLLQPGQRLFSTESDFAKRSITQSLQKVAPQQGERVACRNIWWQSGHLRDSSTRLAPSVKAVTTFSCTVSPTRSFLSS